MFAEHHGELSLPPSVVRESTQFLHTTCPTFHLTAAAQDAISMVTCPCLPHLHAKHALPLTRMTLAHQNRVPQTGQFILLTF